MVYTALIKSYPIFEKDIPRKCTPLTEGRDQAGSGRTQINIAWLSVCYQPSVRIRKYIFRDPDPRIRNAELWMGSWEAN